jgi:hypothetical protein
LGQMSDHPLAARLPQLVPLAVEWALLQEAAILRDGRGLDAAEARLATAVGVREPGRVRLLVVPQVPWPEHPLLAEACAALGFLGPDTAGLTVGCGVYLQKAAFALSPRLLPHELRHVAQYEQAGSVAAYLAVYIPELLRHGYDAAPLEEDARRAEGTIGR